MRILGTTLLSSVLAISAAVIATPASAAECLGNCGSSDDAGFFLGDVVLSPTGKAYDWVSTTGGIVGRGRINRDGTPYNPALPRETNGSELISDAFFATAGSKVEFFFNYVTTDGSGFADYAFAQLVNRDTNAVINLFTARTQQEGNIVPGQGLPAVQATLLPPSVEIQNGTGNVNGSSQGPQWGALGNSGACFAAGCGLTEWVKSTYEVQAAGSYELRFGVTNWSDQGFDSGLAFDGLLLDGQVIGDGSSADDPLLPDNIVNGSFQFEFTATPNQVVFIDPLIAVGYTYEVGAGSPNIMSALFPELGDADGYEIYTLGDILIDTVLAGVTYNFGGTGVTGFKLKDIEVTPPLDPTDQTAFVTGLSFNVAGLSQTINISQTPITLFVPDGPVVPEPATWATMALGFGLAGAAIRRRRRTALA